ncbi:MAG TPA: nucleoside-diphosphate kinase [Ktedonobacterales bacterium]|nr:nucleoside-diphosphate kinase [Ktedonobacterales bacterium]
MERTLIIVKPDGVQRGLTGQILARFEARGFKLAGLKLIRISRELAERHYAEHQGKPFYEGLVAFITSSPVVVGVVEGPGAIAMVRAMMGATNPANAAPGTMRGDFATSLSNNVIHGSDGPEAAQREVSLFFSPNELFELHRPHDTWIFGD